MNSCDDGKHTLVLDLDKTLLWESLHRIPSCIPNFGCEYAIDGRRGYVCVCSCCTGVAAASSSFFHGISQKRADYTSLFIFRDSLADVGNNNNLTYLAKANFHPYRRAFPGGIPTRWFSNGFTAMDYLLKGVNFASGASGIKNYSGRSFGQVIPLEDQVKNFMKAKQ